MTLQNIIEENTPVDTVEDIVEDLYKTFPDLLCNCHTDEANYVGDHRAIVTRDTLNGWLRITLETVLKQEREIERKEIVEWVEKEMPELTEGGMGRDWKDLLSHLNNKE